MTVRLTAGKHGRFLVLDNDIYIGRILLRDGEYSEPEVELFQKLVGKNDVVVEAGSNIGAHTVPLAKLAGRVIAFEPQTFIFRLLCGNIAMNECYNVDVYPAALGAENGVTKLPIIIDYSAKLNFGGVRLSTEGTGEQAAVFALDNLRLESVGLIKADVEGMEIQVIKGALDTIKRCRPYLYLEDDGPEGNKSLHDLLRSLDYQIVKHQVPLLQPGDPLSPFPEALIVNYNILGVPISKQAPVS